MFGKLEAQELDNVLLHQYMGRLGCSAGGRTYVVPISYAYDGTYIYAHTHEGKKIDMMRENPEVCFQTDTMENMACWKSVICRGKFEEVTDKQERVNALEVLLARELPLIASQTVKLTPSWPFHPDDLNEIGGIVFRIGITEKTGRFETIQKVAGMNAFV